MLLQKRDGRKALLKRASLGHRHRHYLAVRPNPRRRRVLACSCPNSEGCETHTGCLPAYITGGGSSYILVGSSNLSSSIQTLPTSLSSEVVTYSYDNAATSSTGIFGLQKTQSNEDCMPGDATAG